MPSTDLRAAITALLLAGAMLISAWLGLRQRSSVAVLAMLSFVWLTVDRYFEGPVLVKFSKHTGVVTADIVGVLGFAVAAVLGWRHRRSRRRTAKVAAPTPTPTD